MIIFVNCLKDAQSNIQFLYKEIDKLRAAQISFVVG